MSKSLSPYLNFDGNCAEAMKFYAEILGGEPQIMPWSAAPGPSAPGTEDRVMHATLAIDGLLLYASDTFPGAPFNPGNNVHLSLDLTDPNEQTRIYKALSEGGTVGMELGDQFFGRFGSVTDKFGVNWMLMLQTPQG